MKVAVIVAFFVMLCISCTTEKFERTINDGDVSSDADVTDVEDVEAETDTDATDESADIENDADESDDSDADAEIVCTVLTIDEMFSYEDIYEYYGSISPSLGDPDKEDGIGMMFYPPESDDSDSFDEYEMKVGEYELGTGANAKISTCTECIYVIEDYNEETEGMAKLYVPESGILKVTEVREGTYESKGSLTAKMIQVYLDMVSGEAIPVPGGSCVEFKSAVWDTICVADCTGKVCGSDGCGGFCGDGCDEGTQCNADQTECIPCTQITLSGLTSTPVDAPMYKSTLTENVAGVDTDDRFELVFAGYQDAGIFDLATGDNANFSTCKQCVLLYTDASTDSETKTYFQKSGTVTTDELVKDDYGCMSAESAGNIENVRLVEVSFEGAVSTPVKDGGCFDVTDASWDTMPAE